MNLDDVLLRAERGELGDIWKNDREELLPALSRDSKELNEVLSEIYSIDITEEIILINSLASNPYDIDVQKLIGADEKLVHAILASEDYLGFGHHRESALRKIAQFASINNKLDANILLSLDRFYSDFCSGSEKLSRDSSSVKYFNSDRAPISVDREKLDSIVSKYESFQVLISSRNIDVSRKIIKAFVDYTTKRNAITGLIADIDKFENDYRSLPVDQVSGFRDYARKQISGGFFSDGELLKRCRDNDYFEGESRLKKLEEEINYAADNKKKLVKVEKTVEDVKREYMQLKSEIDRIGVDLLNADKLREVYEKANIDLGKIQNENIERIFDEKISRLRSEIVEFMDKCIDVVNVRFESLSQQGIENTSEYERVAELYKKFEGITNVGDRLSEIERKIDEMNISSTNLPEIIVENAYSVPDRDSDFYQLVEIVEGKGTIVGWKNRLEMIDHFVSNKVKKKIYASSKSDIDTVCCAYEMLQDIWKERQIGIHNMPCLDERARVADTLNMLHNYMQECRVIYGV